MESLNGSIAYSRATVSQGQDDLMSSPLSKLNIDYPNAYDRKFIDTHSKL